MRLSLKTLLTLLFLFLLVRVSVSLTASANAVSTPSPGMSWTLNYKWTSMMKGVGTYDGEVYEEYTETDKWTVVSYTSNRMILTVDWSDATWYYRWSGWFREKWDFSHYYDFNRTVEEETVNYESGSSEIRINPTDGKVLYNQWRPQWVGRGSFIYTNVADLKVGDVVKKGLWAGNERKDYPFSVGDATVSIMKADVNVWELSASKVSTYSYSITSWSGMPGSFSGSSFCDKELGWLIGSTFSGDFSQSLGTANTVTQHWDETNTLVDSNIWVVMSFDIDPRVGAVTVDDLSYASTSLPKSFLWFKDSMHSISVESSLKSGTTNYVFTQWSDGSKETRRNIKAEASGSLAALYSSQTEATTSTSVSITRTTTTQGKCIIATAAYGSELAPAVQSLRHFRDNIALSTFAGTEFMTAFNAFYYSFSPTVASYVAGSPTLQMLTRALIYPLIGILQVSTCAFLPFSFSSELGVTVAGLVASSLIGLVYGSPLMTPLLVCAKKRKWFVFRPKRLVPFAYAWIVTIILIGAAEMLFAPALMTTATVACVLLTLGLSATTPAFLVVKNTKQPTSC